MCCQELCDAFESVMKEAGDGMVIAPLAALGVSNGTDANIKPGEGDLDLGSKTVQVGFVSWPSRLESSACFRSTTSDSSST